MCDRFSKSVSLAAGALSLGSLLAGCDSSAGGEVADMAVGNAAMLPAMEPTAKGSADAENAPREASSLQISIDNFAFSPRKLTVDVGAKVTWVNRDDVPHTATSSRKPRVFDSGTLDTDDKYAHVFTTPGIYDYFCALHPHMTGQIIVKQP